jgi:DNA-binding XRE family transcriptional regulator
MEEINEQDNLLSLGFDSLLLMNFKNRLSTKYNIDISLNEFFLELNTVELIANHVYNNMPKEELSKEVAETIDSVNDDFSRFMEHQIKDINKQLRNIVEIGQKKYAVKEAEERKDIAEKLSKTMLLEEDNFDKKQIRFIQEFVSKYNNKTKHDSLEKNSLEKALDEKKKQIDNLVTALSKSSEIEDILLEKIKNLKTECANIENKIIDFESNLKQVKETAINIELINSILKECETVDTLPRDRQKLLIDVLIDKIYWYGTNHGKGRIKIKFTGLDDEEVEEVELSDEELQHPMLQFRSHSVCKVNKTAIYKDVFKTQASDCSLIYSTLPEGTILEKLIKLRMLNGYTQREFAHLCSVGYSSICKYEIGYNPNVNNLKKICNAFNIKLEYFI